MFKEKVFRWLEWKRNILERRCNLRGIEVKIYEMKGWGVMSSLVGCLGEIFGRFLSIKEGRNDIGVCLVINLIIFKIYFMIVKK